MKNTLLLFLLIVGFNLQAQITKAIFFVGPKFNFNFGNGEHHFSGGLEVSAWTLSNANLPPYGADFGFEFEREKCRIYAELQTGALLGLSAGPVLELTRESQAIGFQSSVWAAFFLGTDMRYRRINYTNYFAPGFFFKVPVLQQGNFGFF